MCSIDTRCCVQHLYKERVQMLHTLLLCMLHTLLLCTASIQREPTFVLQSISKPMGIVFEFIPQVDRFQFLVVLISSLLSGV